MHCIMYTLVLCLHVFIECAEHIYLIITCIIDRPYPPTIYGHGLGPIHTYGHGHIRIDWTGDIYWNEIMTSSEFQNGNYTTHAHQKIDNVTWKHKYKITIRPPKPIVPARVRSCCRKKDMQHTFYILGQ